MFTGNLDRTVVVFYAGSLDPNSNFSFCYIVPILSGVVFLRERSQNVIAAYFFVIILFLFTLLAVTTVTGNTFYFEKPSALGLLLMNIMLPRAATILLATIPAVWFVQYSGHLEAAEELHRSIIDTLGATVVRRDRSGHFTFGNAAFLDEVKAKGIKNLDDLKGKTDKDLFPEKTEEYIRDDGVVMSRKDGKGISKVEEHPEKGRIRYVHTVKTPVTVGGEVVGVQALYFDVTDLVEKPKRDMAHAQSLAHVGSWEYNLLTGKLVASEELYRIFGFEPFDPSVSLDSLRARVYCDDQTKCSAVFKSDPPLNVSCDETFRILLPTGVVRYVHARTDTERYYDDGEVCPLVVFGAVQDVTEIDQLQRQLFSSKTMLEQVLDAVPQCIFWKNRELKFEGCNKSFLRRFGFKNGSDVHGLEDFDLPLDQRECEHYRSDEQQILQTGHEKLSFRESQTFKSSFRNGARTILETSKVPLHDPSGTIIGVLGVFEDVSEKLQHHEDLVAFISHSLKSRISVLEASLLALKGRVGPTTEVLRIDGTIAILKEAVFRARKYSLLGNRERMQSISVNSLLATAERARPDNRFTFDALKEDVHILGQRLDLGSALLELIVNAKDFAPPIEQGGWVRIWAESGGDECKIHVADNGPGLPRTTVGGDEFVWPTRPERPGLGLAFAKYVSEKHAGKLREIGQRGSGAHFVLELPVTKTSGDKAEI
ncbi:MAG: PAS domain-containing protein [Verrucomicrobia bacterium]|nr:PAS domain-containing protein [Verrucomicrobiota bacterium]